MHHLPIELQQVIFDKLEARDRAMLYIALPKQSRKALQKQSSYHERTLSCIARAIKKKRLHKVSESIKVFLKTCYKQDPTCEPIIAKYPDIVMKCKATNIVAKTLREKLDDGTITIEEVKSLTKEYIGELANNSKTNIFNKLHINSFEMLWKHSIAFKQYCLDHSFLITLAIYGNSEVLERVLEHREKYAISTDVLKQFKDHTIIWRSLWLNNNIMELLLSIFSYSKAELLEIYNSLMEVLYVESAERIEHMIDNLP